ncbi:4Fe-4S single cluster domain-containing protein [Micromonospora pallida]|uniref:4Fe-4S single cluster domain-containing protein n=1 Tax=Micromonospora pallida TaxID=145854 RepID=A0A1C6T397_9ACTN|nr:4Fe-4S cluster-binding domain-containing protein [Micromonospora pallida]SCL36238.1 4Fe-4S single cluster domain-containing protein [Micromonospora pallida]
MSETVLEAAFATPQATRESLIGAFTPRTSELPTTGSSFFIHLSELCPVACLHCMYSSDLQRKSAKDSLSRDELTDAIHFINESRSQKLNITGGGEPFLKFNSILRLLTEVTTPKIDVVSAGYWGKEPTRANTLIRRLDAARAENPAGPEVILRLSLDRYHLNAPRPVRLEHYGNVARAWAEQRPGFGLGFRSIEPDWDIVDRQIAEEIGARLVDVNDWNRKLVLPDGREIPITFNVFRRSGKASELAEGHHDTSRSIHEYYNPFETGSRRLSLATTVNDAIRGNYAASSGVAVTLNSDGTFWIFCGTAPDRRLLLGQESFAEAVATFFQDPITHLLVEEGVWSLSDLVIELDKEVHAAAMAKNDVASLVEDLLDAEDVRLAVTLVATQKLLAEGRATLDGSHPLGAVLAAPDRDLLAECRALIAERRSRR